MKFKLLIPDPYSPHAYPVIHGLRDLCDKIYVCASPGTIFSKISCPSSYSHYVTEVFSVESPAGDWVYSFYRQGNTEKEEKFLAQVLDICKRKSINLIVPINEPAVYLFSKNIQRFKALSIEVPVPEYSSSMLMMDKLAVTALAEKNGIACPRTFLLEAGSLEKVIATLGFPMIIKPRLGLGSSGVRKCADEKELYSKQKSCKSKFNELVAQEYIPSRKMIIASLYLDKKSDPVASFCYKAERPDRRIFFLRMGANELTGQDESLRGVIRLLKALGFKGCTGVQFRVDSRDNTPKFLEMNVKMSGSTWMDMRLGMNRPLFNYYVYSGKDLPPLKIKYRKGAIFLSPVEDAMTFLVYLSLWFIKYALKLCFFFRSNLFDGLPPMKEMIRDYKSKYMRKGIEVNSYHTNFLKDPLVSLSGWLFYFYKLIKEDFPDSFVQ